MLYFSQVTGLQPTANSNWPEFSESWIFTPKAKSNQRGNGPIDLTDDFRQSEGLKNWHRTDSGN